MEKRGSGETPPIIELIRGLYKGLAIRSSELIRKKYMLCLDNGHLLVITKRTEADQ